MKSFEANITLLPTTSTQGRQNSIHSGYRPHFQFNIFNTGHLLTGVITLLNKETVYPGGSAEVEVQLVTPQLVHHLLNKNKEFEIYEGGRQVGIGIITEILDDSLTLKSVDLQ